PTGRKVTFHPDPVRYGNTYVQWLAEKRDWCISRQLWWGHRIPIWAGTYSGQALHQVVTALAPHLLRADVCARLTWPDGTSELLRGDGLGTREKAPHPNPLPEGRGAVKLAPLRPRSGGERAKTPSADAVAAEGTEGVEVLVCLRDTQAESALAPVLT